MYDLQLHLSTVDTFSAPHPQPHFSPKPPLCQLSEWHLPLTLTGVIPTSSSHCSIKWLAQRYMLIWCKCHIADLVTGHINERQSLIIYQRGALSLTSKLPHLQNVTEGQRTAHHRRRCWGFRHCDTLLDKRMRSCALMKHALIDVFAPSTTHTQHIQTWLQDEGGWLMKAWVHYYNIVSVEASSFEHNLDQMKCDWVVYFLGP